VHILAKLCYEKYMKRITDYLPESKQAELRQIVTVIINLCDDIEMIILFGSYARGDWKEAADLAPDRKSGHPSDYDILAVTRKKGTVRDSLLWEKISTRCNALGLSASVRIIVHEVKFIQERLKEIHYFFSDIVKEGCLLYDTGNYQLQIKHELKPQEKHRIASGHFHHWNQRGQRFFEVFEYVIAKGWDKEAAFNLHQAAESAYKAFLLVYTNYCPYEHFLALLDKQAREILPSMAIVFPRKKQTDVERFKRFDYAYIGARYDPDFHMTIEDLHYLSERVKHLLDLTEKLCKEKIESFIRIKKHYNGEEAVHP
jgi:predicted nucleotidyltransferase/HEPN domain-containing protein